MHDLHSDSTRDLFTYRSSCDPKLRADTRARTPLSYMISVVNALKLEDPQKRKWDYRLCSRVLPWWKTQYATQCVLGAFQRVYVLVVDTCVSISKTGARDELSSNWSSFLAEAGEGPR